MGYRRQQSGKTYDEENGDKSNLLWRSISGMEGSSSEDEEDQIGINAEDAKDGDLDNTFRESRKEKSDRMSSLISLTRPDSFWNRQEIHSETSESGGGIIEVEKQSSSFSIRASLQEVNRYCYRYNKQIM
jgi:hypothetical protein